MLMLLADCCKVPLFGPKTGACCLAVPSNWLIVAASPAAALTAPPGRSESGSPATARASTEATTKRRRADRRAARRANWWRMFDISLKCVGARRVQTTPPPRPVKPVRTPFRPPHSNRERRAARDRIVCYHRAPSRGDAAGASRSAAVPAAVSLPRARPATEHAGPEAPLWIMPRGGTIARATSRHVPVAAAERAICGHVRALGGAARRRIRLH